MGLLSEKIMKKITMRRSRAIGALRPELTKNIVVCYKAVSSTTTKVYETRHDVGLVAEISGHRKLLRTSSLYYAKQIHVHELYSRNLQAKRHITAERKRAEPPALS